MRILLSTPTLLDERFINTRSCGQCVTASDATDRAAATGGRPVTDQMVLAVYSGITDQARLLELDSRFGVPSVPIQMGTPLSSTLILSVLGRSHRLRFVHQCNGNAEPRRRGSTRVGHWRTIFGFDSDTQLVTTYSPWGGIVETFPLDVLIAADLRESIDINVVMPRDRPVAPPPPAPPPAAPEDDMAFLASAGSRPPTEGPDPNGQGAVYKVTPPFKQHLVGAEAADYSALVAEYGALQDWSGHDPGHPGRTPFNLDHEFIELHPIDASYPVLGWTPQPPHPAAQP